MFTKVRNSQAKPPDCLYIGVGMAQKMVKKILVIENRKQTRELFIQCLNAEGFDAMGVQNGLIGFQQAHEELPDLILSEIKMPKLDGYGVLEALRQNPATAIIPLIFVTTKKSKTDIRKAFEMGADDYLIKPCTKEELLKAIAACLTKRSTLQQCYATPSQSVLEAQLAETTRQTAPKWIFPCDPEWIPVFQFIEVNYHRPITLSDVAAAVGYSPAYLTNLVRRQTGKTVQSWIIERRMTAARSLLLQTNETVDKIAIQVGYQSMVHFFRQFRQYHGTTPQAWRSLQLDQHKQQ